MATPHVHDGEDVSSATLSSKLQQESSHRLELTKSGDQGAIRTPICPSSCGESKQSQVYKAVQNLISALTCWLLVQLLSLQVSCPRDLPGLNSDASLTSYSVVYTVSGGCSILSMDTAVTSDITITYSLPTYVCTCDRMRYWQSDLSAGSSRVLLCHAVAQ